MANQIIAGKGGTSTVISDTFSPYGEVTHGPSRVDDPEQWHPQLVSQRDTCKRYNNATIDDLFAWQSEFGFPKPARTVQRFKVGEFGFQTIHDWSVEQLDAFDDRIRAMHARVPKR